MKENLQKKLEEQRRDKEEFDDKMQELHRKSIKDQSEFEKQKALMEQKIQYLEKNLEEKSSNEKQYLSKWNNQKFE